MRIAEITTRDINRGDKPHFFLKEIHESVESVSKTFRGKFEIAENRVRFLLGRVSGMPSLARRSTSAGSSSARLP